MNLTASFLRFVKSGQSGGVLLIACTLLSLALANSPAGGAWLALWHTPLGPLTLGHWINDALMAVFFLLIGLELERELQVGELSNPRSALLPVLAAIGGMVVPALIHVAFNAGTPTVAGFGIPMATDIAFALGILALLGARVPPALKVFVVAFAVIDDLGAILVIAIAYTNDLSWRWLAGAAACLVALVSLNRALRVMSLAPYLIGGAILWVCLLKGGVHASVAGVLLAFTIPFTAKVAGTDSPSHRLEHALNKPVTFGVLPLFALANTGVIIDAGAFATVLGANGLGIVLGLLVGKPVGVSLAGALAVKTRLCALPEGVTARHILGAGLLGGIGFTMSIFITNLAFADSPDVINASKLAILLASLTAGALGFTYLRKWGHS